VKPEPDPSLMVESFVELVGGREQIDALSAARIERLLDQSRSDPMTTPLGRHCHQGDVGLDLSVAEDVDEADDRVVVISSDI